MTSDLSKEKNSIQHCMAYQRECMSHQLNRSSKSMLNANSLLVGGINDDGGDIIPDSINLQTDSFNNHQNSPGLFCSANIFGSNDSISIQLAAAQTSRRSSLGHKNYNTLNVHELVIENQALREQLAEVTSDRNRLLCEISNLRLEIDMCELKRLPDGSFEVHSIEHRSEAVRIEYLCIEYFTEYTMLNLCTTTYSNHKLIFVFK